MLGVAISSTSPQILTENGQLLLELQGYTISDSLTTLLQHNRSFGRIRDLLLKLATDSFIYAKLCYSNLSTLPKRWTRFRVPYLYCAEWIGYTTPSLWERAGKPFRSGNWFESLNAQISVKCLSALLLSAASVILRPSLHFAALRYQRDIRLFFCVRGYNSISGN